jgi:hypothetical protein
MKRNKILININNNLFYFSHFLSNMTISIRFVAENNNVWNLVSNEARVILDYERISC